MTTTEPTAAWPDQITLPGQTHTAPGPLDMTNMYLAHHAFRRDLDRIESAVRRTPNGDLGTWQVLGDRWRRFGVVLHHHHTIEDVMIWPVVMRRIQAEGDVAGGRLLRDMGAEHDLIDPTLQACDESFAAMLAHPCDDHRNALDVHVTTARQLLLDHLRHEETDAIPLLQRSMTLTEWEESEAYAQRTLPKRHLAFLVPWIVDGLPERLVEENLGDAPLVMRIALRLFGPGYQKRQRAAFRYA